MAINHQIVATNASTATAAGTNPTRPASPSCNLTIYIVG